MLIFVPSWSIGLTLSLIKRAKGVVIKCLLNEFVKFVYWIVWIADSFEARTTTLYIEYVNVCCIRSFSISSSMSMAIISTCAGKVLHKKLTRIY